MSESLEQTQVFPRTNRTLSDRFEVIETLGQGAAGVVYRVRDRLKDDKEVALKLLTNAEAFDEHTLVRFKDELEVCRTLRHPNLVEAYDLIVSGDNVAFTMEYVEGRDLASILRTRPIRFSEADSICSQVLSALSELHSHKIVHRDIKLENVLLRSDGVVKLSDLGLMKQLRGKGLTRTGVLLGTAQYMPPEYIQSGNYDARGEVYAMGILLFEMLTGKRRLADMNGNQAIEYLIRTKFEFPRIALVGLPRKYVRIIEKSLQVDPRKRYQTVDEMRKAFEDEETPEEDLEGGVQVGSRLKLSDYQVESERLLVLQNSAFESGLKRSHVIFLALLSCVTVVVSVLILRTPVRIELDSGIYEANVSVSDKTHAMALKVTSESVEFTSDLQGCSKGSLNVVTGAISCDSTDFSFLISDVSPNGIKGTFSVAYLGVSAPIHLERTGDLPKPEKSAAVSGKVTK